MVIYLHWSLDCSSRRKQSCSLRSLSILSGRGTAWREGVFEVPSSFPPADSMCRDQAWINWVLPKHTTGSWTQLHLQTHQSVVTASNAFPFCQCCDTGLVCHLPPAVRTAAGGRCKGLGQVHPCIHSPRSMGKPEENVLCQCSIVVRQLPARNVQINVVLCGINLSPL